MKIPTSKILEFFGMSNYKDSEPKTRLIDEASLAPREVYLEWDSIVKKEVKEFNKRFSRTFIIIAVVISLLLVVMQEFGLIFVVASLIFFLVALERLPEHTVHIEVSSHGIKYGETMYYWQDLRLFFFKQMTDGEILVVDTNIYLPGRLFFSFNPADRETIKQALSKHITFMEKEPLTFLDKAFNNVKGKFNI